MPVKRYLPEHMAGRAGVSLGLYDIEKRLVAAIRDLNARVAVDLHAKRVLGGGPTDGAQKLSGAACCATIACRRIEWER